MTPISGKVVEVIIQWAGSTLDGDHASGAGTLTVANVSAFDPEGGRLRIDGDTPVEYDYTTTDEDSSTIVLSGVLSADADDEAPVLVLPDTPLKTASVALDLDGDEVIEGVRVPHDSDPLLAEGIRDPEDAESVTLRALPDGEYEIDDVLGRTPRLEASSLVGALPPGMEIDPVEPASSPTPVTVGGLRQVFVKYEPISNPSLVEYEVHVTDDSAAAAPTPGDTTTLFLKTPATLVSVNAEADGTPFEYDWDDDSDENTPDVPKDYYFAVIAMSGGLAAAPSAWVAGRMDRTASGDLVAGSVTTETLNSVLAIVGMLQVGDLIEITPPGGTAGALTGGIVVNDPSNPGGEPLVRLHPLGCSFRGQVVTDILTVMQDLIINGLASLSSGASLTVAGGVSDPSEGPVITQGPVQSTWPAAPSGYTQHGICWDPTGGQWVRLLERASNLRGYMQKVSTAGVEGSIVLLDDGAFLGGGTTSKGVSGITVVGSSVYYVIQGYNSSFGTTLATIIKCSLSTGTHQTVYGYLSNHSGSGTPDEPALGTDGTHVYAVASGSPSSLGSSDSTVFASKWDTSLNLVGSSTVTGASSTGSRRFVGVSDFGYGAAKLTFAYSTNVEVYALPTFSGGSVAKDTALSWSTDLTVYSGGIAFKTSGADQFFYSTHNDGKLSLWDDYYPAASEQFWMTYADTDGSDHTDASPVTSQAIGKRRFAFATLRPAPSGVTGADLYVGYGSSLPGTFYKRPETISGRVFSLIFGKDTSGSTTVPSSSTMGGVPGEIKSEATPGWVGRGDGTFDVNTPTAAEHATPKDYVDGLLAAKMQADITVTVPSGTGGVNVVVNFPYAFSATPSVVLSVNHPDLVGARVTAKSTTGFTARFDRATATTYHFNWIAVLP